ncbi:unnamed protein product [Cylindrotheca closterium]|uniref:DUF7733 domain-containing protein n=1 Tax=Cylindrotheca closterium TaxID=2856 RepID=A0AAD2FSY6_9STRA|nr:unnamed protein product [Cylindrotheca closterium]
MSCLQLLSISILCLTATGAFHFDNIQLDRIQISAGRQQSHELHSFSYSKGADIWPPTNEDAVRLADTFPNGQIPYSAVVMIEQQDMTAAHQAVEESINGTLAPVTTTSGNYRRGLKKKLVPRSIQRILRRAAAKEEVDSEGEIMGLDRTPIAVALALLIRGLVRPLDIGLVACFTTYLIMLGMVARSPRQNGMAPMVPAIPPQGHVPFLVSNPMGMSSLHSRKYDMWLKVGVLVGLVGPVFYLLRSAISADSINAMIIAGPCARSTFLLCAQAISESVARRVMAPLPLRILTPILYNTARLGFVWHWMATSFASSANLANRSLAIANGVYWFSNLFFFLLPVATMRYMRAHFLSVEASEVKMRIGMEESIGLVPNQLHPGD